MLGLLLAAPLLYCPPVALRSYDVFVGKRVMLRVIPGCAKPALVRKRALIGSRVDRPVTVPTNGTVTLDLFLSYLQYSEDGRTWKTLKWGAR